MFLFIFPISMELGVVIGFSLAAVKVAWCDTDAIYVRDCPNVQPPRDAIIANDLHSARIIACQDPTNVPPTTRFFAGVLGSVLGCQKFVETKGQVGVALAFKPAVRVKRLLFLTPSFVREHRDLCAELAEVLQLQDCCWQLLNRAGLIDAIGKLNAARARQLIVLRSDAADESFGQVRLQFAGLTEAVQHWIFCSEDKSRSRSGIAASY
jgi:hypothetical protein